MIKVQEGIYRYDGELNSSKTPLVIVHPWYGENVGGNQFKIFGTDFSIKEILNQTKSHYLQNLENLLRDSADRNIFLFEEEKNLEINSENIIKIREDGKGFYIIPTKWGSPTPSQSNWDDTIEFIGAFNKKIDIAGGYVWESPHNKRNTRRHYTGCAGGTYDQFLQRNYKPRFVDGCCFE